MSSFFNSATALPQDFLAGFNDLLLNGNPMGAVQAGGSILLGVIPGVGEEAGALSSEIAATFSGGRYTSRVLAEDMTAFRYSATGTPGRFLTTAETVNQISSPVLASIALNLPAANTAEILTTYTIPAGTTVFTLHIVMAEGAHQRRMRAKPGRMLRHFIQGLV